MEKYFNNTILPIIILILTSYFTNTNEQNFANILMLTIVSIIPIILTGNFLNKFKNINITPVNKKENLLELKRVLMDIKIKCKINEKGLRAMYKNKNMVFFFDESFHSRKINKKTIEDKEFFDNYVMTGIGCLKRDLHKMKFYMLNLKKDLKNCFLLMKMMS